MRVCECAIYSGRHDAGPIHEENTMTMTIEREEMITQDNAAEAKRRIHLS